jgi:hypothetical protein
MLRRKVLPPSSKSKKKSRKEKHEAATSMLVFCWLYSFNLKMKAT